MSKSVLSGVGLINKAKTHCPKGHILSGNNLLKYALKKGVRSCKSCHNERQWNNPKTKISQQKYNKNNIEKRRKLRISWKERHPNYFKEWNKNNPEKMKRYYKKHHIKNKEKRNAFNKIWREKNPDYQSKWRKENPRSSNKYSIDLQEAMNNVRIRDKNTCKWYKCGLSFRNAPIQVHHIFPRNEYPDLELIQNYMICYCANHHWLWHKYRGDSCARLIIPKQKLILEMK